jgi:hypothetical protein
VGFTLNDTVRLPVSSATARVERSKDWFLRHAVEALIWARIDQFAIEHTRLANGLVAVKVGDLRGRVKSLTVKLECICGEALNIHFPFCSRAARGFIADMGGAKITMIKPYLAFIS